MPPRKTNKPATTTEAPVVAAPAPVPVPEVVVVDNTPAAAADAAAAPASEKKKRTSRPKLTPAGAILADLESAKTLLESVIANFSTYSTAADTNETGKKRKQRNFGPDGERVKKAPSAYNNFVSKMHPVVSRGHPGIGKNDILKEISKLWAEEKKKTQQ